MMYDPDNPYDDEYLRGQAGDSSIEQSYGASSNPDVYGDMSGYGGMTGTGNSAVDTSALDDGGADTGINWRNIMDGLGNLVTDPTIRDIGAAVTSNVNRVEQKQLQEELRRQAIANLNTLAQQIAGVITPELSNYITRVQRAVMQGEVDPAQAMAAVQEQTELNGIEVPQQFKDTQQAVLDRLGQVANQGYTAIERAAIQKALDQMNTNARGEQEAIKNDFMARGQWGAGQELVQRQMIAQAAAQKAAQQGLDIEAEGLKRALGALTDQGQLATQLNDQSFKQQAEVAGAQDTINKFNAELRSQMNNANAQRQQEASKVNIDNAMTVQRENMAQDNLEAQRRAELAAKEEEQRLARDRAASEVARQAGSNAASMWKAPYEQQLQAQQATTQAVGNATAGGGTVSGPKESSSQRNARNVQTAVNAYNLVSDIWSAFSDPTTKNDKKQLSDDEVESILDELVPHSFTYKSSVQKLGAPAGPVVGIMSTDLRKTPGGAGLIKEVAGKDAIDGQKALSLALAAVANLNKRVSDLEN